MKNILFCALILLSFSSCNKYYYIATTTEEVDLFPEAKYTYRELTIPGGSTVILSKKSKNAKYRKIKYNEYEGYIYNTIVFKELRHKGSFCKADAYAYYLKNPKPINIYNPANTPSPAKSDGYGRGRVNVKGYTRKDGTYVRPHTRSAPRRH